jgi:hypothetical protein
MQGMSVFITTALKSAKKMQIDGDLQQYEEVLREKALKNLDLLIIYAFKILNTFFKYNFQDRQTMSKDLLHTPTTVREFRSGLRKLYRKLGSGARVAGNQNK